ncbi:DNA-J chaperone, putative [Bodo saltans]|nr:DNA-J chaperone, putative [Bodo saltans]|eukprot:CUF39668.1 DNA-J chaperone, putative [Bodo saltans]
MLRCHIVLSDSQAASEVMAQCKSNSNRFGTSVLEALTQEQSLVTSLHQLSESCDHKLWSQALDIASKLCSEVPESPSLAEKRIEILVNTAATAGSDSAKTLNEIASATLKFPLCGGIWYWYGVQQLKHSSNFQDVEAASRSLQRAVSLSGIEGNAAAKQELQKVRYLESKAAMATAYQKSKRWRQAVAELTMLLTLNGVSKGLKRMFTCMRAKAFMALDRWMECMSDATYLLNHATTDDEVVEAYILRAEAFLLGRNREAAIRDARCASGVLPGHSVAAALLRQLEMDANKNNGHDTYRPPTPPPQRKSSSSRAVPPEGAPSPPPPPPAAPSPPPRGRPDSAASARSVPVVVPPHYTSLNVSVSATSAVITKSYLKWHPDRWTSSSAADVLVAEEVFKKLNTAYHTLTDDALRLAYDREHGVRR